MEKQGRPSFSATKFRWGEGLYEVLVRLMEEDLGLLWGGYCPEGELKVIRNGRASPADTGLTREGHRYPGVMSLDSAGGQALEEVRSRCRVAESSVKAAWESYRLVKKIEKGAVGITRCLEAKLDRNGAEIQAASNLYDRIRAWAEVSRAIGALNRK